MPGPASFTFQGCWSWEPSPIIFPQESLHLQGHFQGKDCNCLVPLVHKEAWQVLATSLRMKDNLDPSSSLCGVHSRVCVCVCVLLLLGFPGGASGKELACQFKSCKRRGFDPWVGKIPWRRAWQPTPVFLPGKSHGRMSLVCVVTSLQDVTCSLIYLFIHSIPWIVLKCLLCVKHGTRSWYHEAHKKLMD